MYFAYTNHHVSFHPTPLPHFQGQLLSLTHLPILSQRQHSSNKPDRAVLEPPRERLYTKMAANNMVNPAVNPETEDELFAREVEEVKAWWSDSRWRNTKRPFTAEQIVSKRGHLKIEYPSNAQSKKLWDILENRFKVCMCLRSRCELPSSIALLEGVYLDDAFANRYAWTEQRCQLHLRLLGAHHGDSDGQVSRHSLRLWVAIILDCLLVRRAWSRSG